MKTEGLVDRLPSIGAVPGWAERRIAGASSRPFDVWLDAIFDADDILKPSRPSVKVRPRLPIPPQTE